MNAFPSQDSIVDQLEIDGLNGALLAKEAMEANSLERIQSLLWMMEMKLFDELATAATLWPTRQWLKCGLDRQLACACITSISLSLQMAYRERLRQLETVKA